MTFGNGPEHDTGDALAKTTREIRPSRTDWSQHAGEVGDGKLGDRPIANGRKNVRLERADPVRRGTRTAPPRTPKRMHPAGRLGKRQNGLGPAKLERVVAGTHHTPVGKRGCAGHTKRHIGVAPETEGAATTVDSDTLRPVAAPGRGARSRSRANRARADRSTCRDAQPCRRTKHTSRNAKKPPKAIPQSTPHEAAGGTTDTRTGDDSARRPSRSEVTDEERVSRTRQRLGGTQRRH